MSATVRDYMNPQLVYLTEGSRAELALQSILDFGITGVPVLDAGEHPIGFVSLRELVGPLKREARASGTVVTVGVGETIAAAAQTLAARDAHQLVVVDETGRAVGILSSLDVVRGLLGLEARHPVAIDRFERKDAPATAASR